MALLPTCCALCKSRTRTIHLSTYNIRHGKGMDGRIDYQRIAQTLSLAKPDVVAVQEVDSMTKRTDNRFGLDEIAKTMRMKAVFAPAINYQGGKYGVGLLCKKKPLSVTRIPLPGRGEARVLLVAEFKHYVVACTHLSLTEADRMASIDIISGEVIRWKKPFFLMGDLNGQPGTAFYEALTRHFRVLNNPALPTFPADKPNSCIDYILINQPHASAASVLNTSVGTGQASDHRPLHATIQLKRE